MVNLFKKKLKSSLSNFVKSIIHEVISQKLTSIEEKVNIQSQQILDLNNRFLVCERELGIKSNMIIELVTRCDNLEKTVEKYSGYEMNLSNRCTNLEKTVDGHSVQTVDLYSHIANINDTCCDLREVIVGNQKAVWMNFNNIRENVKRSKVIYTCLTGDYDNLPTHEYINNEYDYVCFTDNKNLLSLENYGAWKIKPLVFDELDNVRNNRWHKTHPHILFPEYEWSVYVDSNISIKSDWLFTEIEGKKSNIIIPIHFERNCIFSELDAVLEAGKENFENVQKMRDFLEKESFPREYGLNENNVIYRKHNNIDIIQIMEEWWGFISNYTKRDQLSLSYVLWKHNIRPIDISIHNLRNLINDVNFTDHLNKTEFSEEISLPEYEIVEKKFNYWIDRNIIKNFNSIICGWAYYENDDCDVCIESSNRIFKAKKIQRLDIKAHFNIEQENTGFEFLINPPVKDVNIILINNTKREIYKSVWRP